MGFSSCRRASGWHEGRRGPYGRGECGPFFAAFFLISFACLALSPAAFAQRVLTLTAPVGGEVWFAGNHNVTWTRTGTGWTGADTLLIEYSDNGGGSWTTLNGSALSSTLSYTWDVTGLTSSVQYRVRATCIEEPAATSTGGNFRIGSNIGFYVNDASTTEDVYCSAAGSGINDGLSPATPKGSIQVILDNYDIEGGDTVYIDTGVYILTANITLAAADSGGVGNLVKLLGSTHPTGPC